MVMALKYHGEWQSSKQTVLERNAYMFDNELLSDVSIACGESSRVFYAHKYVLATSSTAFFAMLQGDLAQKGSPIRIPDTNEENFEEFLRFLYTDDCKITAENAIGVMYLAKKYLISPLAEKCREILEASLTPDNVFAVLEQAVLFDEKRLEAKCWEVVSQKSLECMNSEAFTNIGPHTLNALLKKETLEMTEVELFKGILKWADSECARKSLDVKHDKTARRRVLGDSVYEISFLGMSLENFIKHVSPTGLLTDAEIVSIAQKLGGLEVTGLKWRRPRVVVFTRFDRTDVSSISDWYYTGGCDALTIAVNKTVRFHGVRLFGFPGNRYEVKFTIEDKKEKIKAAGSYMSKQDSDGVPGYDVMLPNPTALLPDKEYTIIATIKGPSSLYGTGGGKPRVKIDDVVVTFKSLPEGVSFNGTDETYGQFHKILVSRI